MVQLVVDHGGLPATVSSLTCVAADGVSVDPGGEVRVLERAAGAVIAGIPALDGPLDRRPAESGLASLVTFPFSRNLRRPRAMITSFLVSDAAQLVRLNVVWNVRPSERAFWRRARSCAWTFRSSISRKAPESRSSKAGGRSTTTSTSRGSEPPVSSLRKKHCGRVTRSRRGSLWVKRPFFGQHLARASLAGDTPASAASSRPGRVAPEHRLDSRRPNRPGSPLDLRAGA